jgi:hypothetical protein
VGLLASPKISRRIGSRDIDISTLPCFALPVLGLKDCPAVAQAVGVDPSAFQATGGGAPARPCMRTRLDQVDKQKDRTSDLIMAIV